MFNTFGNILENPKVGLVFWDLPNQSVLQLTAHAELAQGSSVEADQERTLTLRWRSAQYVAGACPLQVEAPA